MMKADDSENSVKAILGALPEREPLPYLAGRIAAIEGARRRSSRQIAFWRRVSVTFAVALLVVGGFYLKPRPHETLFAYQPYVIHVNLEPGEVAVAASAEIELPDGLTFVSKDAEIQALRRMRLPIADAKEAGRNRLPFVVKSDRTGTLALAVRIYDERDHLVQTKQLILEFKRST